MTTTTRIALVTGAQMAKPDPETHLLVAALKALGIAPDVVAWQDDVDWTAYPLVVVRTPWDYFQHLDAFLAWSRRVGGLTRLLNPASVLAWNSHKGYLRQLASAAIPTVPTLWLEQGCADSHARLLATGWEQVVVKPAVSIGGIGALRAPLSDAACAEHLQSLVARGDALAQPYVDSIADQGELSLVYFGGRYSHAIRKLPKAGEFRVQDMYGGTVAAHEPDAEARALAAAALALAPAATAYARVDMVRHQGSLVIMELELIEPELFLPYAAGAAGQFAQTLAQALRQEQEARHD